MHEMKLLESWKVMAERGWVVGEKEFNGILVGLGRKN